MATADKLSPDLEKEARRILKLARQQNFKDQIDAFRICVLWWAQSRRIGTSEDQTGSLLDEMRRQIDGPKTSERGSGGGSAPRAADFPRPIGTELDASD